MMFCFLKKTRRFNSDFIYSLSIYLLVVICVSISVLVSSKGYSYNLSPFFSSNSNHSLENLINHCLSGYESSSFLLWIMILLSFSPLGLISPFIIISFKSYGIGLILCNLYLQYHLKGIIFGLLIVLPGLFISLCSLLSLIPHAIKFSFTIFKSFLPKSTETSIWNSIQDYIKFVSKSMFILFLSPVFDFFLFGLFWKFFSL